MKKIYKIIFNWLLVIVWMGVIYYFSDQPSLKSEFEPVWDLIFRKIAHMAEYFVLAFLFFRAYTSRHLIFKRSLFFAFFFSVIYAISDEAHQKAVIGRNGSSVDVLVDSIGIFAFVILRYNQYRLAIKKSNPKS